MSKYDFGDAIKQGSTMDWAIQNIRDGSKVLELGAAVGTLTKHLKEDKNCIVDIVELDEEAGRQASVFARKSYIGNEEGNLESYYWYAQLREEQYDYVVILDVIEHLCNPKKILEYVETLLAVDGVLLLSVPNIAHNSVIIDLYNNKFNYSSLGLLDDTHIHFYSYDGLCKELDEVGLYPFSKEAIQLRVGENEIINSYQDVPTEMAAILRTREFAEVYQFLFRIRKKAIEDIQVPMELENLPYTLYQTSVFNEARELIYKEFVNPRNNIDIEIEGDFTNEELVISLLNTHCVIKNLVVKAECNGLETLLPIEKTNAVQVEDLTMFMDEDVQIVVKVAEKASKVRVVGEILGYGTKILEYMKPLWGKFLEQKHQLVEYKDTQEKLYAYIEQKEKYVEELLATIRIYEKILPEKEKYIEELFVTIRSYEKALAEKENTNL